MFEGKKKEKICQVPLSDVGIVFIHRRHQQVEIYNEYHIVLFNI